MEEPTKPNAVVLEVHEWHQEIFPTWREIFDNLGIALTFYTPNVHDIDCYLNMFTSDTALHTKHSQKVRDVDWFWNADEQREMTHLVVNTFPCYTTEKTTRLLRFLQTSQIPVLLYVHRPEDLFIDVRILPELANRSSSTLLVFSCEHGYLWFLQELKQKNIEVSDFECNWALPVHSPPKRLRNTNQDADSTVDMTLGMIGMIDPSRRNFSTVLDSIEHRDQNESGCSDIRLRIIGRNTPKTAIVRRNVNKKKLDNVVDFETDVSFDRLIAATTRLSGILVATNGSRYETNALTGSISIALTSGVPPVLDEHMFKVYSSVLDAKCCINIGSWTNDWLTDVCAFSKDDLSEMKICVEKKRSKLLEESTALVSQWIN